MCLDVEKEDGTTLSLLTDLTLGSTVSPSVLTGAAGSASAIARNKSTCATKSPFSTLSLSSSPLPERSSCINSN